MFKIHNIDTLPNIAGLAIDKVHTIEVDEKKYNLEEEEIFDLITKYKNVKGIIIKSNTYFSNDITLNNYLMNNSFNKKIALIKKLSNIEVELDDARICFNSYTESYIKRNMYYTYCDHMLFINLKTEEYIPKNIKHLNIMNVNNNNLDLLNNLPNNIQSLHFSCTDHKCIDKIKNLPIMLYNLSITIITYDSNLTVDFSNIKIPFGCEFEHDYLRY